MVTRPTNHMISTRDHSYDLVTWPRHVTYKLHPDIKSSSILTSASWLHPSLSSVIQLLYFLIIRARVVHRLKKLVWASNRGALEARKEDYFKSTPVLETGGGSLIEGKCLERYSSLIEGSASIATTGAWSRGSALNRFRPLGEPRVKW